jgi:hypothetical protein
MVNDLVVKSGGHYFGDVRRQFLLGWFVRPSGQLPGLGLHSALPLMIPNLAGRKFALYTLARPTWSMRLMLKTGALRPIYIYRDPRDVARSMFEHGKKIRSQQIQSDTLYGQLETMEDSIRLASTFIEPWRQWMSLPDVWTTTYEQLRLDPVGEMLKICGSLDLRVSEQDIEKVVERYQPGSAIEGDAHLDKAGVGAWKETMTPSQIDLCHELFGQAIEDMGYDL